MHAGGQLMNVFTKISLAAVTLSMLVVSGSAPRAAALPQVQTDWRFSLSAARREPRASCHNVQ